MKIVGKQPGKEHYSDRPRRLLYNGTAPDNNDGGTTRAQTTLLSCAYVIQTGIR